jgi:chaperonin GroES
VSPTTNPADTSAAAPAEPEPTSAAAAISVAALAPANLAAAAPLEKLPIKMLHDRVLVRADGAEGERRSTGGILIPATAQVSHRLAWAQVVAVGQNVRTVEAGDRVLYDPDDRAEVEVRGVEYVLLRERDIHAVAAERLGDSDGATGLYL